MREKPGIALASIAKPEISLGIRFDGGFLYQPEVKREEGLISVR